MEMQEMVEQYCPFWEQVTIQQKELILKQATMHAFSKGSMIQRSDESCSGLILVKNGELRVSMLSEDGREITLYRLGEGEACTLSAACVLDEITFDVFMDAAQDSELIMIPTILIRQIMNENIYVENYIYKQTVTRFSDVMWAMQQILFMSMDRRMAIFLLDEIHKNGDMTIRMTQEEMARNLGSAREVVSRMLKYFVQEGYVEVSRGVIKVIDKKKLQAML